ncbi:MAG: hypothetical protein Gyms2KO_07240 [Gymnodinialimonas sp.]
MRFPLADILGIAAHAHLDRTGVLRELGAVVPLSVAAETPLSRAPNDPFLWSLTGSFGGTGAHPRPGAIFACARYGLETRDVIAANGLASRQTFALMRFAQPQFDDTAVWPEGAVARLYCSFVWDDARVVEIMAEAATREGLGALFQTLTDRPAPPQIYGEEGYRIDATGGRDDSVVQVESARMTLTLGHQSLTFRSFLMGGGV